MFLILVVVVVWVASLLFLSWRKRPAGVPPGPRGIPLFGNALQFRDSIPAYFLKNGKSYGGMFSVYLGPRLCIVLTDYALIKEAFLKLGAKFSGRPILTLLKVTEMDKHGKLHGLLFPEGSLWREQRTFALSALRDFGMGKLSLEGKIHEEVTALLQEFRQYGSKPFDCKIIMQNAVSNVICNIIYGNRFEYGDKNFLELLDHLNTRINSTNFGSILNVLPFLMYFSWHQNSAVAKNKTAMNGLYNYTEKRIREHQEHYDRENIRDFIDAYLKQIEDEKIKGNVDTTFTVSELVTVVGHLFIAGTETTSTTLRWFFLYMMNHPDMQRRIQEEIEDVVGHGRLPSVKDRPNMPYTEAFMMEVQRISPILPINLLHKTTTEAQLNGYAIPSDTIVIGCIYASHMDPTYFPEPEKFNPERFIDADGNVKTKCDGFMPFSIGWRVCLGEMLAKMELFLFFTAILQNFTIVPKDGCPPPTVTGSEFDIGGAVNAPLPYEMRLIIRE